MYNQSNKKTTQTFFHSYLFLEIIFIVALMTVFSYTRTYYRNYQIKQEITQLENQAKELEVKKLTLLEKLDYVKSLSFVEQKAKVDLGMVKVGEKAMVIPGTSSNSNINNGQVNAVVLNLSSVSNYRKWWDLFMKD